MTKSTRTWDEFHAQGLLLGMYYDATDHTFFRGTGARETILLDADTMDRLTSRGGGFPSYLVRKREEAVKAGMLGASDWLDILARNYYNVENALEEIARNGKHAQTDK